MKTQLMTISMAALLTLPAASEPPSTATRASITLESRAQEYIELRRDLHRHPELSNEEARTARIVADRLEKAGLKVRRGVGGHGVVAILAGGLAGGVVGYRADMDAVRSSWPDPVDFASLNPGVRHVCGHDLHTAVGVAIAEALAAHKATIPGTVLFIFQGAEESASGAEAMLADKVFGDLNPTTIFALHTGPLAAGTLGVVEGPTLIGRDRLEISLRAKGQEKAVTAALSKLGAVAASEAASEPDPRQEQCSFMIQSSGPGKISAQLDFASKEHRQACRSLTAKALETFDLELQWPGAFSAGVWSTPEVARRAEAAIQRALGSDGAVKAGAAPPMFSEDFGSFLEGRSGAMFWLGVGPEGIPHTPGYVADEAAILAGAKAMVEVLLDSLDGQKLAGQKTV